jgi:hypothetical protein
VLGQPFIVLILSTILALVLTTACGASPSQVKPVVDVISPPDGAYFAPGERIALRVAAASSNQISRVELRVQGALITAQNNPTPSETFSTLLEFTPQQAGPIELSVTAVDTSGASSDPVTMQVVIGTPNSLLSPGEPAATADPGPDSAVVTDGTPSGAADGCKLSATFEADVTIPDNTVVNAGSSLVKTWRMRNTSECAWDANYQLAYIEGEQMGAPGSVPVAPTARDSAVDISVPFTAPITSGVYTSTWRLRAPNGNQFGNRVFMVIRVP